MKNLLSYLKEKLTFNQRLVINVLIGRGNARSVFRALVFAKSRVHQISGNTNLNRYPAIFGAATAIITETSPKILSFGCSTGEEVLTLRHYFPKAVIIGSEIDVQRLEICRALPIDQGIIFIDSSEEELRKYGPYDAIFAMAVLQRLPHTVIRENIKDISRLYPFRKFEAQLVELDQYLRPGGVIFLKNTQYRFCDTEISSDYDVVLSESKNDFRGRIYDKNSRLLGGEEYLDVGFQKLHVGLSTPF